jgi:hypothetical protein
MKTVKFVVELSFDQEPKSVPMLGKVLQTVIQQHMPELRRLVKATPYEDQSIR